jgi:hypothetical protein
VKQNNENSPNYVNTAQYASAFLVNPETVRSRYFLTGSYFGIVPNKLPNGRLAWPLPESENDSTEVAA